MKAKDTTLILVTGGAGFIGSNLIKNMVNRYPGRRIISLDNYFTGKRRNHIKSDSVVYLEGDTRDIKSIWKQKGYDSPFAIFHLGEYSRIPTSFDEFDLVWEFNVNGTKEVVKFCSEMGARLVYAGSSSKFGNQGEDENLSPYSWVKAKAVELINNYSQWYSLDFVITYFYNVYGADDIKGGDYERVIKRFERQFENGEELTVYKPGTQTRDFTHIDDIVEGILTCFEKGKGDGYELGTGREYSMIELAKMFGSKYKLVDGGQGDRRRGKANTKKANDLGWKPKIKLEDYIAEFTDKIKQKSS